MIRLILEGLLQVEDDEDEFDIDLEQGPCLSAGFTLKKLAHLIRNDIIDLSINFIAENIQSQNNWQQKYAGLIALSMITEGPDKQKFLEVIAQLLDQLLQLFSDQSPKVREAVCHVFKQLAEHHPDIFLDQQVSDQFLPLLKDLIDDKPKVSN